MKTIYSFFVVVCELYLSGKIDAALLERLVLYFYPTLTNSEIYDEAGDQLEEYKLLTKLRWAFEDFVSDPSIRDKEDLSEQDLNKTVSELLDAWLLIVKRKRPKLNFHFRDELSEIGKEELPEGILNEQRFQSYFNLIIQAYSESRLDINHLNFILNYLVLRERALRNLANQNSDLNYLRAAHVIIENIELISLFNFNDSSDNKRRLPFYQELSKDPTENLTENSSHPRVKFNFDYSKVVNKLLVE